MVALPICVRGRTRLTPSGAPRFRPRPCRGCDSDSAAPSPLRSADTHLGDTRALSFSWSSRGNRSFSPRRARAAQRALASHAGLLSSSPRRPCTRSVQAHSAHVRFPTACSRRQGAHHMLAPRGGPEEDGAHRLVGGRARRSRHAASAPGPTSRRATPSAAASPRTQGVSDFCVDRACQQRWPPHSHTRKAPAHMRGAAFSPVPPPFQPPCRIWAVPARVGASERMAQRGARKASSVHREWFGFGLWYEGRRASNTNRSSSGPRGLGRSAQKIV